MADELIERLRAHMGKAEIADVLPDCREAATRIETLEAGIERALRCTPTVRDGAIIYDCGDPWEQLRQALGDGYRGGKG